MREIIDINSVVLTLEEVDRFDPYNLDRNEFTEEDHDKIRAVVKYLKARYKINNYD